MAETDIDSVIARLEAGVRTPFTLAASQAMHEAATLIRQLRDERDRWKKAATIGVNNTDTNAAVVRVRSAAASRANALQSQLEAEREECAKLIEEGFEREVGEQYLPDRRTKNDKCKHGRYMYEDCEQCCADACSRSPKGGKW